MLPFIIIAGSLVISFIVSVIFCLQKSKKPSTVPGLDPARKEDGNLGDISKAGSVHEFLLELHKQFGPIASFWWGPHYVVSIANSELFKEHQNAFDRPPVLFQLFKPLFGAKSITYANRVDGRARRNQYDKCLTYSACKHYFIIFREEANVILNRWKTMLNGEHVPLTQDMFAFSLKTSLASLYGEQTKNEKEIYDFKKSYDLVWAELERRLTEPPNEERETVFLEEKEKLIDVVRRMVKYRKESPPKHGEELLIDLILDFTDDEEWQFADIISYMVAAYHTTGNVLSWAMYFLAKHQDCQEKAVAEIKTVLEDEDMDHTHLIDLKYLKQVIDETLRCAVVAPFAARFQDFDSELGGHRIPKNTPVFHALGVASKDANVFPRPDDFDPDRFTSEHTRERPHLAFSPFGFSGKRVCPGKRYAYSNTAVLIATLLQKFKVSLVEGQNITPVHGLVTHPNEEIWITLSKR